MNTQVYMEHANISVNKIERSVAFFTTAFPNFKIRGGDTSNGSQKWIHLGDEHTYLALNESLESKHHDKSYEKNGINHIGFVVKNVRDLAERMLSAGYKRSYPLQIESVRIRDYFLDDDGNEFEFVEYLTEDTMLRNQFE